jgi:hypothetical protein
MLCYCEEFKSRPDEHDDDKESCSKAAECRYPVMAAFHPGKLDK